MQGGTVLCELPDAQEVFVEWPLPVAGGFVVEIFAGERVLTLALLMDRLPCMRPWDSLVDERFCVLANGFILMRLAEARMIAYAALATPCQSQS